MRDAEEDCHQRQHGRSENRACTRLVALYEPAGWGAEPGNQSLPVPQRRTAHARCAIYRAAMAPEIYSPVSALKNTEQSQLQSTEPLGEAERRSRGQSKPRLAGRGGMRFDDRERSLVCRRARVAATRHRTSREVMAWHSMWQGGCWCPRRGQGWVWSAARRAGRGGKVDRTVACVCSFSTAVH